MLALVALSGCKSELFEETGGGLRLSNQAGQVLTLPASALSAALADGKLTSAEVSTLIDEAVASNPHYDATIPFDPASLVIEAPGVQPTAEALAAVDLVKLFSPEVGFGLSGLLGITSLWLNKRKTTAEKAAGSLVAGLDTFRDALDQTPSGAVIDAHLVKILRDSKEAGGPEVIAAIEALLSRYATPSKPVGGLPVLPVETPITTSH